MKINIFKNSYYQSFHFLEEIISPRREQTLSIDSDVFTSNPSINVPPPTSRKPCTPTQNSNSSDTNGLSFGKHGKNI